MVLLACDDIIASDAMLESIQTRLNQAFKRASLTGFFLKTWALSKFLRISLST